MDIDSVPLGIDFVDHVTEQIGRCSAVIVMIGKQWRTIKDEKRRRRLEVASVPLYCGPLEDTIGPALDHV